MAGAILFRRAYVKHDHFPVAYSLQKSLLLDRFHRLAAVVELPDDHLDLGKAALGERAQSPVKVWEIVAYCRGPYCVLAVEAVKLLRAKGFRAVRMEHGVPEWRAEGFPVTVGEEPR